MIKPITKPNFFILGAAKSGSTLLYNTLKNHPEIFFPSLKEPNFFCRHIEYINNPADYFALFDQVTNEKIIGDNSHIYLSDPSAAPIIKAFFPDAKFLITLRNPADRAYSMYINLRRDGFEFKNTFEKALEVEEKRLHSEEFKKNNPQYFYNYLYFHSGLFGQQIQRYFSLFERKQFHIITLNQLKNNFKETIKNILLFLEVDPEIDLKQGDQNTGKDIRFFLIQRLRRKLPRHYRKYIQPLVELNKTKKTPMKEQTRATLIKRYEEDLKLLNELTNIDLRN
jgi:hypothetical protein